MSELVEQRSEIAQDLIAQRAAFEALRSEMRAIPGADELLGPRQREIEQTLVLAEKRLRAIDWQIETIDRPVPLQ